MDAADNLRQGLRILRSGALRSGFTTLGIGSLLVAGSLGLRLTSGRVFSDDTSVAALARLSQSLIMLQSFHGEPSRAAPRLWSDRLGVEPAGDLWRRYGRSVWWKAWSQDGEAYLVLPASALPPNLKGLHHYRVGALVVLASDALHRQQLERVLNADSTVQPVVQPHTLLASCLISLDRAPAVFWRSDAVASLSGTLAPLLQQGREGCVRLQLTSDRLRWDGVIGERPLSASTQRVSFTDRFPELVSSPASEPSPSLLRIEGRRLDLILGTLLSRQIIQTPLETHYGLNAQMRTRLADRPFALRLQPRESGGYRAGLQVQLQLDGDPQAWQSVLEAVTARLQATGFERLPSIAPKAAGEASSLWRRRDDDDNALVGGWQWLQEGNSNLLSIGFGIRPASDAFVALGGMETKTETALTVQVLPDQLKQLDLLSGRWPKPVERASVLRFRLNPLHQQPTRKPWWRMNGELRLAPQP